MLPDGHLHDDGYFTWAPGKRPPGRSDHAGWRAEFYLAATIDALRAELRAMTDDRDSWCAQASARTEDAVRFAAERDSALTAYTIQKRERERLEGELTNCEARIREQRAEINRLAALKAALNHPAHTPPTGVFVQAAQDDQARDAGRLALLETALSEVLEFQSAPEGPHIFDWGRWRRIRDNTPPFQRAATKETP